MNSIDHHFISQFYLKQWVNSENNKLIQYKIENNRLISVKEFSTKGVAYQKKLYALQNTNNENVNDVETWFSELESRTNEILVKILKMHGKLELEDNEKKYFAAFIYTLFTRSPKQIASVKQNISLVMENIKNNNDNESNQKYKPGLDIFKINAPAYSSIYFSETTNCIDIMSKMRWFVDEYNGLTSANSYLLTGDFPLIAINNNMDTPKSLEELLLDVATILIFPLSYKKCLLMSQSYLYIKKYLQFFDSEQLRINEFNKSIIKKSKNLIFGINKSYKKFIEDCLQQSI